MESCSPDYMGASPSQVSNSKSSCPNQTTGEQTDDVRTVSRSSGPFTEELPTVPDQTELLDIDVAVSTNLTAKTFEPSAKELLEDVGMESPIVNNGILEQIGQDQQSNCNSIHEGSTVGDAFLHNECADDRNMPSPGAQQIQYQENGAQPLKCLSKETEQHSPEDVIKSDHSELLRTACRDAHINNFSDGSDSHLQCTTWKTDKAPSTAREGQQPVPEPGKLEIDSISSHCISLQHRESLPAIVTISSPTEQKLLPADIEISLPAEHIGLHNDGQKSTHLEQLKTPSKGTASSSSCLVRRVKRSPKSSKKCMSSSAGSNRTLRSKSQDKKKATEPSGEQANVNSDRDKQRTRKKKRSKEPVTNEYKRIRSHLRYLLNRIKFEQSLIVAYSGDGWKGQNLEKLKPEKELQRASSDIFRVKAKIRDLFKHIDSLCTEGNFPASLFDSDGEISSEDIYCAKCQSKDVTIENDIILCDGACDRGFHQFCLVPPLLKEDIPPDDEGWLCPGCDCKVDCIGFLNDYLGTNLSIGDSWEKVFPEAAATASATDLGSNFGLPSDDSDDDDYDPDGPELEQKNEVDGPSSDESDFTSASGELDASNNEKLLGLPSDDSEDDDFDPDCPFPDETVKEESSGSDFSSDSEDLDAVLENDKLAQAKGSCSALDTVDGSHDDKYLGLPSDDSEDDDYNPDGQCPDETMREENSGSDFSSDSEDLDAVLESEELPGENGHLSVAELGGMKNQSLNSELLSTSNAVNSTGSRNVERLDYKKLYDETYGNGPSESSDDEDYTDTVRKKVRKVSAEASPFSTSRTRAVGKSARKSEEIEQSSGAIEHTPKKRLGRKGNVKDEGSSQLTPSKRNAVYKRIGEAASQRLRKSFEENQYPDLSTKEKLAKELELTVRQVGKWFENTRWHYNHPAKVGGSAAKRSSKKAVTETCDNQQQEGNNDVNGDPTSNGGQNEDAVKKDNDAERSAEQEVLTPQSSGRKRKQGKQIAGTTSSPMTPPPVIVLGLRANR